MSDTITIKKPFDAHVHFRRGAMLRAVVPHTTRTFSSAIVMPNTEPPIGTTDQALEYQKEIMSALSAGNSFKPLLTLYLTKELTAAEIDKAAASGSIRGVKYYPWGYSINSQWGPRDVTAPKDVLAAMEKNGIPLLIHSEVHLNDRNEEEDPYEGEKVFFNTVLPGLLSSYPNLKISLEHISTALAAEFVEKHGKQGQLVATITPHHLVYDRTDAFRGGYRSLLNCKPLIKTRADRDALRALVAKGFPFVYAGTDSAPHPESRKFSSCCVYGAFCAPVAVELYAQVFDELGALDKLEGFLSAYGPLFFGIPPSEETITLEKKDWQVTDPVVTDDGAKVWPICHKEHGLGNEVVHWQVQAK